MQSNTWRIAILLLLAGTSCAGPKPVPMETTQTPASFDWQGHRGARGLAPENTIPAFLKALEFPEIRTLELDLAVSADGFLVVSHEPWMSSEICARADGTPVEKAREQEYNLYKLSYQEIQAFDCGSRGNARFPEQIPQMAFKPTLDALVKEVENYCSERNREVPFFNIEIKSTPEWDGVFTPAPEEFVRLVAEKLRELNIEELSNVQSFDPRPLRILRQQYPGIKIAYLFSNAKSVEANIQDLGFTPEILSPYFGLITRNTVEDAHAKGLKIIPWTVNETKDMERLRSWGVDGIITDYPDRIPK